MADLTAFREYDPAECGDDGYPLAWHRCQTCDGLGWLCAYSGKPADGTCCDHPSGCPSSDGCTACTAPGGCGGAGSLKQLVRVLAGHRCVRCAHPFLVGESKADWSPCDRECRHFGPFRHQLDDGRWVLHEANHRGEETGPYIFVRNGIRVEAAWRVLTVHHLDGDKRNCRWFNLAALCQRCHLTIQGKVVMDRRWLHEHSPWFRLYVAGYYAHRYLGEDVTREQAVARMDELLALEHRQEALL